jgi:tryptophan synthase alpha subunit
MADTYAGVGIGDDPLEHLVNVDGRGIAKAKQRVVCEHDLLSECRPMQERHDIQQRRRLVAMHYVNLLSYADLSQYAHQKHEGGKAVL